MAQNFDYGNKGTFTRLVSMIKSKLAKVAFSGKYSDLSGTPTIPTSLPASNTISDYSATGTSPVNGTAVNKALQTLDVASKGGAGKYIQAISETDGKISATEATMPTALPANGGTAQTISETLPIKKGGTGKTTGADAANVLLNSLSTGSATPVDADYFISQYAGGGTATTTYHRRPVSALWNYIKGKLAAVATTGSYADLSNKPSIPAAVAVKGNAESAYRTGNVNLTPANIGAVNKAGDTMTGTLNIVGNNLGFYAKSTDSSHAIWMGVAADGIRRGFWDATLNKYFLDLRSDNILHADTDVNFDQNAYVTGSLILSKTTDASGTADLLPALIVGGARSSAHLELDANEIMAKSNGTTTTDLYLNNDGGKVHVGPGGLAATGELTANSNFFTKRSTGQYKFGGTAGTAGWVVFAQIKITSGYVNGTLQFRVGGRGRNQALLQIMFNSIEGLDPGLYSFGCIGPADTPNIYRLKKTATSTWQLAAQKNEAYGEIYVMETNAEYMDVGITVTYPGTQLATAPDSTWTKPEYNAKVSSAVYADALTGNGWSNVAFTGDTWLNAAQGKSFLNFTAENGLFVPIVKYNAQDGSKFVLVGYQNAIWLAHIPKANVDGNINSYDKYMMFDRYGNVTLRGNLLMETIHNGVVSNQAVISIFDDADGYDYGFELVESCGGNMFIGSGESPHNLRNGLAGGLGTGESYEKTSERLYLSSDDVIFFYSNCGVVTGRKCMVFDNTASLRPIYNNGASLGNANNKWTALYVGTLNADTINGSVSEANTAVKLKTIRSIDGVKFDGTSSIIHYGECTTAATSAAKIVGCPNFVLETGATIKVKFKYYNSANNPTLNVNATGAKAIYKYGAKVTKYDANFLKTNHIYEFVYNGTGYELVGDTDTWQQNTSSQAGYVSSPGSRQNVVWGIGVSKGSPGWRNPVEINTSYIVFQKAGWYKFADIQAFISMQDTLSAVFLVYSEEDAGVEGIFYVSVNARYGDRYLKWIVRPESKSFDLIGLTLTEGTDDVDGSYYLCELFVNMPYSLKLAVNLMSSSFNGVYYAVFNQYSNQDVEWKSSLPSGSLKI